FLQLRSIPVNRSALWPTKTQAHQAPRGDIDLGVCRSCGMVFNVSFDPQLLTYDTSYENSLDFSPAFQEFARDLASRLINTYGIRRKHVIEIGCGTGDFLKMLCQTGDNQGFGLDPSYDGESMAQARRPSHPCARPLLGSVHR